MKKSCFLFVLLLASGLMAAQTIPVETLRKEYHYLNKDSVACVKLYAKISTIDPQDNLTLGYKGATTAAMANFAKGKAEKIKLFNSGKKMLEQSINADTTNPELRFLRFTVQTNAPKALGYHTQIENDKKYMIAHYNEINNPTVKGRISEYLLGSGKLSEEEKKKLKSSGK
jgi:hypothetical protein